MPYHGNIFELQKTSSPWLVQNRILAEHIVTQLGGGQNYKTPRGGEKKQLYIRAIVQSLQLKFVVGKGLQRLCSMWLAAVERNGDFYQNGREEKQHVHRL